MSELEKSILLYGKERNQKQLESVIQNADPKLLYKLITNKLGHPNAIQFLNYVFLGLSNSGPLLARRGKIIEIILESINGKDLSTSEANTVVNLVICETSKLKPSHMVKLSQWCVQSIQKSENKYMIWKDLLPNLLNSLNSVEKIEHSGTEMSGSEYRRQVINSLCMASWNPDIIISLASMFSDLEMSPDEHLQVMCKLCEGIEHLEPSSIPPLVHHLLLLSHNQHGLPLFLHLQRYFTKGLYNPICSGAQESSSEDFITEDLTTGTRQELLRAESTILFYIKQSASAGHANVRDFLNSLKNTTTVPEESLNPFFLTVLLSISFVTIYEEQVFDLIKSSIARVLAEENRRERSAWLQNIASESFDLDKLITQLIESSGRERELIREGLVKLGFALLRTGKGRSKDTNRRQVWKVGRLIVIRLVRKYYNVVPAVVELLFNHIVTGENTHQYVDTLLKLSVSAPLLLSECQNVLKNLIELLLQLPGSVSQQVVECVMPLARTFPTLRDCLMLVLRKAVFSCNLAMRLMAVKGFLLLLKTLDTRSLNFATQSSQSTQTSLSQVHSELVEGGEAIGIEVVGVLRRCVAQQLEVRVALYTGLFDAVHKNVTLYPYVLELLIELIKNVFRSEETAQPPLDFEKAIYVKDMDVILKEPIALLIFVAQQFVTRHSGDDDLESMLSLKELRDILEQLCKRMSTCTLENLGIEEGVNLNDPLPENRRMNEIFIQCLGVYEALMAYILASWSVDSTDRHQELISLFRNYTKFVDFGKNSSKPGRSGEKGSKGQKKNPNDKSILKSKPVGIKKSASILDMKSVILILDALFSDSVSWATSEDLQPLRNRRDFQRYALQVTLQLLNQTRNSNYADVRSDPKLFSHCSEIGSILYQHFLHVGNDNDLSIVSDSDSHVFVLAIECINELFSVMTSHFTSQFPQFLEKIGTVEYSQGLGAQLQVVITSIQKHLVASLDEEYDNRENDPILKKTPLYFVTLLSQLAMLLPSKSSQISEFFSWIKNFVKETTVYNVPVTKEILSLLFRVQIYHKIDGPLFDNVALQLLSLMGTIDEDSEPESVPKFAILSEVTQIVCLQQLCSAIKHMVDDVDWMVARLKGAFAARAYPSAQSQEERMFTLRKQEKDACSHISHCVKLVTILTRISLPDGAAESVLKLLLSVYSTVSNMAKYFCIRSSKTDMAFQAAHFTSVIQLTAVVLAKRVHWLLLHVMADAEGEDENKKPKKVNKVKLAKELKDSKLAPRIVYGMEVFEKNVILLSKKCNVNLMEKVKVHSGRDFRIKMDMVQSVLQDEQDNEAEVEAEQSIEQRQEDEDEEEEENEENEENEPSEAEPVRKKKRPS